VEAEVEEEEDYWVQFKVAVKAAVAAVVEEDC
jgi:hypothetical protein